MSSDVPVPAPPQRIITVSHRLPLHCTPDASSPFHYSFSLNPEALPLQLSSSLPTPRLFVGTLPLLPPSTADPDRLSDHLLTTLNCLPVFLDPSDDSDHDDQLHHDFYHKFCKHYLWPLLHSLLPVHHHDYDDALYRAYVAVGKRFAERVTEVVNAEQDFIWVHDYHLITLSSFLRRKFPALRMGFFLHSPFPTSEIFRTIPVREELLCGFLNFDMVGFQTYNYARHFLSSCLRVLGLRYQCKGGCISVEYHGRNVIVKILPVGIDMNQVRQVLLSSPETAAKISELKETYKDRVLMVGADDVDLFKGVRTKFRAMGKLLEDHPEWRGRLVLVQISNPARSEGSDIQTVRDETRSLRDQINARFGQFGYEPIVMIEDRPVSVHEKAAFYAIADCCVVNAVRDGMNCIPYTYTACRQLSPEFDDSVLKRSAIVVSEFVGCSPSLSGAIRVNPWSIESVSEGMASAISMSDSEKQLRHKKHYNYISSHDVAYWAWSFDQSLRKACEGHLLMKYHFLGFGMTLKVVALGSDFENLPVTKVKTSYKRSSNRLVLLDYDGTMLPQGMTDKRPTEEVIEVINRLCSDPLNVVFVVSGRGKDELAQWFAPCEKLGISAEHGYYTRWGKNSHWENSFCNNPSTPFTWMSAVKPVMELYTEVTDGSYIESKDSALVWHYQDAESDFGSCQANDLLENLETVLANESAVVKKGHKIVEVNPQGISKDVVVEKIIKRMRDGGKHPDFVLCIGDDGSDEDMFVAVRDCKNNSMIPEAAEVFACTVGNKPSKAKYYLDDTSEVLKTLKALVGMDAPSSSVAPITDSKFFTDVSF